MIALSAIIGVSVLTGAVAAAEDFKIKIDDANPDPIRAGEDLDVEVTITNDGTTGSQNITLLYYDDNDDEVIVNETNEITVPGNGGAESKTIVWEDVPNRELIEPAVKTENATDDETNEGAQDIVSQPINVRWSNYEVQQIEVNRTDLSSGKDLKFNATIENTGTYPYSRTVYLNRSTD